MCIRQNTDPDVINDKGSVNAIKYGDMPIMGLSVRVGVVRKLFVPSEKKGDAPYS